MKSKSYFLFITILLALITNCGGGGSTSVTAKILLPDGTEKNLSDKPLPLNLRIQLTFSNSVDPTETEERISLVKGGEDVPHLITWNSDNTVMIIKPNDRLDYQATYNISLTENASTSLAASLTKATITNFDDSFETMVRNDVNGDGKADPVIEASHWNAGDNTGRVYLFYGEGLTSGIASDADAVITGDNLGDYYGFLYSSDINDDGFAEIFNFSALPSVKGQQSIFMGGVGSNPISGSFDADEADLVLTGTTDGDFLIYPAINDVNGDNFSDMLLGAPGCNTSAGCIYIFFGPTFESGPVSNANVVITGENANDGLYQILTADINDDATADIIASAPYYNTDTGRIYMFYGGSSISTMSASAADVIITGENTDNRFMRAAFSDVNGDGIKDLIARAENYDLSKGRVYVFFGPTFETTTADNADVILTGETAGDLFSARVVVEDINNDNINDILVGAPQYNGYTGRIYVFLGSSDLSSKNASEADVIFTGENAGDRFSLSDAYEVNGDNIEDIIASSWQYPNPNNQGRFYVFFGSASMISKNASDADVKITGENNGDFFSFIRSMDINGDGVMDLIGGSPNYNADTGRAYIFYGGSSLATGSAFTADVTIAGENAGDQFGW